MIESYDCRLTPIKFTHHDHASHAYWDFYCECGNKTNVRYAHYKAGAVKSCGCLLKEHRSRINERLTPEGRKKAVQSRLGKPSSIKGKTLIYEHYNNKKGKKKYVTQEQLEQIWRSEIEVLWDEENAPLGAIREDVLI